MLLYFIRHGDPIYNPDSLTEKGKIQAEALSNRLVKSKIDRIYCSSSTRAIQTAEPTAKKLGREIEILDWCNEKYAAAEFGIVENEKWKWIFQSEECLKKFSDNDMSKFGFEWYESQTLSNEERRRYKDGIKRIQKHTYELLKELGYEHNDTEHCYTAVNPNDMRVALFAHDGFSRAFMSAVLDIPYPYLLRFEHNHTGMTVIEFFSYADGTAFARVLQYSNDSHLYKESLKTEYNNRILI